MNNLLATVAIACLLGLASAQTVQPTQPPVQPTQPSVQPTQPPVQPTLPPVQPTQPPVTNTTVPATTLPATTVQPGLDCGSAIANATLDYSQLNGTWLEGARAASFGSPLTSNCSRLSFNFQPANVTVNTTLSLDQTNLANQTSIVSLIGYDTTPGEFHILQNGNSVGPTYKVLETNYIDYLFVCAYYNATLPSGALVLYRESSIDNNHTDLETAMGQKYSDFRNLVPIYQGDDCSGSATIVPMTAVLVALTVSMMRFFN